MGAADTPTTDEPAADIKPGVVLLVAAAVALVCANTGLADAFEGLWTAPFAFGHDVRGVIDDWLMTIFFFTVGLEIRHEIQGGVLSTVRRAVLPAGAALGGMLVPALIYAAFNAGGPGARGWGIPVATDIAFALGVLALVGPRVPPALRILLLALAVIDDVGAIAVIAIFYAGGIHPTVAGVVLGLLLPSRLGHRLQRALALPVAYVVMPLFALSNAGVSLREADLSGGGLRIFLGIAVGLVAGKLLGVLGAARALVATGLAALPPKVGWRDVSVLGAVAGIGFTMSLFIAHLAFPAGKLLATAKLGIVAGSVVAAGVGYGLTAFGLTSGRRPPPT